MISLLALSLNLYLISIFKEHFHKQDRVKSSNSITDRKSEFWKRQKVNLAGVIFYQDKQKSVENPVRSNLAEKN